MNDMLSIDELRWGPPQTIEILEEQIKIRQELIKTMVGQLYPSIVTSEICILHDLIYVRKTECQ